MKIEITKEDLKDLVSSEALSESIAEKIVGQKIDNNYNEFDKELLSGIKLSVEQIMKEYLKDYYDESDIKGRIEQIMKEMTREDIIKLLQSK